MNNAEKLEIARNIINNEVFKSDHYKRLLLFLVDSSINNFIPNEIDIAEKVFDRKNFDPSDDTLVRVYIYQLRKKLRAYYEGVGKDDEIQLKIPKGSYKVEFFKEAKTVEKRPHKQIAIKHPVLLVFGITAIVLIIILSVKIFSLSRRYSRYEKYEEKNAVLSELLEGERKTVLAIGDLYSFMEFRKEINSFRLVRDDNINKKEDLDMFLEKYENYKDFFSYHNSDNIPHSALRSALMIQPYFIHYRKEFTTMLSSAVSWEEVKNSNIIYIGHFHNLGIFRKFLPGHIDNYEPKEHPKGTKRSVIIKSEDLDTVIYPVPDWRKKEKFIQDVIVFAKVPGPTGNSIFLIVSFTGIGRLETGRLIVDPGRMATEVEKITPEREELPRFYCFVFLAKGFQSTSISFDLIHFKELAPKFNFPDG